MPRFSGAHEAAPEFGWGELGVLLRSWPTVGVREQASCVG